MKIPIKKTRVKKAIRKSKNRVGLSTIALMKEISKKEVSRNLEDKSIQYWNTALNLLPSSNTLWYTTQIPVSPYPAYLALNQSIGAGGRLGNQIKIKNISMQGNIYALPYNATSNPTPFPMHVKFWFYYDKQDPNIIPDPRTDFFQNGSASRGMFNDLVDMWAPVNTDRYRVVMTKQFKLGYSVNTGTGGVTAQAFGANNDYHFNQNFSFDLTKHVIKTVKFNDNTAQPTCRGLFLLMAVVQANGTQYTSVIQPCQMQYVLQMTYEDA